MARANRKRNRKLMRRAIHQLSDVAVDVIAEFTSSLVTQGMKRLSRAGKAFRDRVTQ